MPRTETELNEGWEFAQKECGEERFRPVRLPHDWAIGLPFDREMKEGGQQGYRDRFGVGWYRRALSLEEKREGILYYLEFGGVCENSTVWVNGQEAGGHKYGYSTFRLDVTPYIRQGGNQILVKVDTTARPGDRWYSGAGIYRGVKLVEVEEAHFDPWEVTVRSRVEGCSARILVCCGLKGRRVRAELFETDGIFRQQTEGGGADAVLWQRGEQKETKGVLRQQMEGSGERLELTLENAKLWSAEEPNLYTLTLSLLDGERVRDQISFPLGLRTVEMVPGQGMSVNGKRVRLKGLCLHQDAGCLGIAVPKEIFRQRLLALKEMGCNAIRPAHHTYSTEFLDLCDELGFYVYEECFDKWHGGLYGRYFQTEWEKDVDAMVKRDRNHPCIIMWGVGNEVENQGQESMLATLKMLTEYVRTLDDRPVSYAMNPHFKRESNVDLRQVKDIQKFVDEVSDTEIYDNGERVERIEKIARYVDVVSCNYQEQWYPLIHERIPDKLILGTEVYQYFCGDFDQMQNFTDVNPVLAVEDMDFCIGSFIWTGIDYLGESMGWPAKGWGGSLIRTNGSRRPGYYLMQSYWSEKPMVHFSVMDYSLADEGVKEHWDIPMLADHWHFPQFCKTVIPYVIVSNCQEVRLFLNGKRIYVPGPAECPNRRITGFLPYLPGKVEAVGLNEGEEVCRHVVRTPGMAVRLGFVGDAWSLQRTGEYGRVQEAEPAGERERGVDCMRVPARKNFQIQLTVGAFDEEGNPCFRERARVRFWTEGPAEILAVDAGEITGHEPYQESAIHMFRGQASVVIALTGEPGRICVHGWAEGLREASLTLLAERE